MYDSGTRNRYLFGENTLRLVSCEIGIRWDNKHLSLVNKLDKPTLVMLSSFVDVLIPGF